MKEFAKNMLKNPINKLVFSESEDIFLVGGFIRDHLLKGSQSKDLDYVAVKNIRPLVNKVSERLSGTVVELRQEHMIRICLKDGTTIDFSKMLGEIKEDLGKRDFTMNSVAWSPKTGLIDPYCGLPDIKHKTIRAVCEANMRNDPLRLLRAYRFSGELRFEIEKNTRKIIRKLVDFIKTPASERITYEFIRLLNSKDNEKVLHMAYEDGMLKELFYINDDKLRDNIKLLHETNKNLKKVPERFFLKDFSQGLCGEGLIRLESLLLGSFSNKLVLSKNILTQIGKTEKLYKTFVAANAGKPDGKLYNLYKEAGCALLDLIVLSGNMGLLKSVDLFQKIEKNGLLSSEEIMTHSGFREGKKLGDLIEKMKMLEFTGAVKNKASAIKLLKAERI